MKRRELEDETAKMIFAFDATAGEPSAKTAKAFIHFRFSFENNSLICYM